jgi:DNA-binding CsgD family transcriptional regulator/PAS domain-containing protein
MAQADNDLLELIGRLHEGVVDDDAWRRALDASCHMIGSAGMLLGVVEQGRLGTLLGHRMPGETLALLYDSLGTADANPWVGAAVTQALRRPVTVDDLGGQSAIERSRLWQNLNRPFGIGDCAGAVLERQPGTAEIVTIGRPIGQGGFQRDHLAAFADLIPHLARAWRVRRMLAEWESLAGTLTFILDRIERAVVVTGPDGQIRFANSAADRLLSRGDGLDATRGRLRAARPYHGEALYSLIGRAAGTGKGADSIAVDAVSIPCASDSPPLAIVAEPLAPAHSDRIGHSASAGALLFIGDSEASSKPSDERLRTVYGLTPAEARLTSLIVEGRGLTDAALALGVSPNTAKYHLKSVFGKVGVTRQAQLVRRVLADVGGLAEPDKMRPVRLAEAGRPRV